MFPTFHRSANSAGTAIVPEEKGNSMDSSQ